MKFCIDFVGGDHPHNMRLTVNDQRSEKLSEEMELCFCTYLLDSDAEVFAITPEQAVDFISQYFDLTPQHRPVTLPSKRTLTPAQLAARRTNAAKARQARHRA
jgi:hypothetical protein